MSIIISRTTTATTAGTGVVSVSTSSATATGTGTLFLTEALVGKALFTSADVYIGTISSINSNTSITLTANAAVAVPGQSYKIGYQPINVPLTNAQIDTNFININNTKVETSDAVSTPTANKVVRRDGNGDFAAGTITAALSGNASTASTLQTARKINNVDFNGSADILTPTIYDSAFTRIVNPGGAYMGLGANQTGAIAITLPVTYSDSFVSMTIKIYEYVGSRSFDVRVSGYYYNGWSQCTAYIVGSPAVDRRFNIRFGYNSTVGKGVIYIGELNSSWQYPTVAVTDVQFGWNGKSLNWTSGWSIAMEATSLQNVAVTVASADSQVGWYANALNTSNSYQVNSLGVGTAASGTAGEIRATNAITSYYSDERLKENIVPIDNALAKVAELSGVTYNANKLAESFGFTDKSKQVGLLAGQVEKVLPEAVKPAPFDILRIDENTEISRSGENYKTVQYEKIVPLLIQAINELQEEVKSLKGIK